MYHYLNTRPLHKTSHQCFSLTTTRPGRVSEMLAFDNRRKYDGGYDNTKKGEYDDAKNDDKMKTIITSRFFRWS